MSYSIKDVNGCTKRFSFNFEKLDFTKEIQEAVMRKQKESNLKGFRPGKAPMEMVKRLFGEQLEGDVLNRFVQKEIYAAIDKEKVKMVGHPSIENVKSEYEDKKAITFDAVVEFFPEFEFKDLSKYSFKREKVEIMPEEMDRMKKNYLESKAEMVESKATKLAQGHHAVLNFQGVRENGDRPENMKGNEYVLEIGSNRFIPGFEEGLVGMKKGEKKNITLNFPADYHMEDLRNAKVVFETELLEIKEKNFPEFTDAMAKEFGYESVADFETKTQSNLMQQKNRAADEKLNQSILEKLVEEHKFDIPLYLIAQQETHLRNDLKNTLMRQGMNEAQTQDYFTKWEGDLRKKAEFQVRSGLMLDKLSRLYNVETSDKDLEDKVAEMSEQLHMPKEKVREYYFNNREVKNNMTYAIREEKTFKKLYEVMKIK